ncbi:HpcH/HpaI aldolase/citrate lyase family protein [Massilia sp. S19_KUP03_FR1]|uniref:HpcH/HpaI aldolase/citrate lyase family protein n=1 Tax=Massilia sp. S19_KUP03_FR1 TaxID=3025503 RepID=UPI002FCD7E31
MPARSYLFVPGDRPERFDKAVAAGADAVIVDLEDAVGAADKASARQHLLAWLHAERHAQPVYVRINAAGSAWFDADLALCAHPGVAGIVLPKAEQVADLKSVAAAGARRILPLVESALGVWNAFDLCLAPQVERLVFGTIDFAADLDLRESRESLLHARSQLVLAARVAGIAAPVDGVTVAVDDPDLVRSDTLHARGLGFGAKLCIHPKQVGAVNAAFLPTPEELAWAGRVRAAFRQAGGAAVAVDGKMVDRPVLLLAERLLVESTRRGAIET